MMSRTATAASYSLAPSPGSLAAHIQLRGALDSLDAVDLRPDEVGQRLADGEPGHRRRVDEGFHGLLADGDRRARAGEMALADHGDVGNGQLQGAGALLPRNEAGDAPVDLVGEEPLRSDGQETKNPVQGVPCEKALGKLQRLERRGDPVEPERFSRHVAQDLPQVQVHGRASVAFVMQDDEPVPGDAPDERVAAKVRTGTKTQTRRTSKIRYREGSIQPIQESYTQRAKDHIKINKRYEQKLGDMTEEEAKAEGFQNLVEFKKEWEKITKQPWNPEQTVTAYEFQLIKKNPDA